jgi:anti-anti-sigma factor
VILGAHKTANDRGGSLVLLAPSPTAKRLLDITGLLDHIEVNE